MYRLTPILLVIISLSCAKPESSDSAVIEQRALALAATRCTNGDLSWLQHLIDRSEIELSLRGSIYAIPVKTDVVFLHQPWISSCYACNLYSCQGDTLNFTQVELNEVMAGVSEANLIYTSY